MEIEVSLATRIEAILYLKGQPLSLSEIASLARCDREEVEEALLQLMDDYAHRDSALEVTETAQGYCLQLRPTLQGLVDTLLPVDLGTAALRTLAAIALKGKILQTELIELRGSGAYQHVQDLVAEGFIRKQRQNDGRSFWIHLTPKFHQYFQMEGSRAAALTPAADPENQETSQTMPEEESLP
jgi:segregation and condensation protein B